MSQMLIVGQNPKNVRESYQSISSKNEFYANTLGSKRQMVIESDYLPEMS
jgi:hypothetical protein